MICWRRAVSSDGSSWPESALQEEADCNSRAMVIIRPTPNSYLGQPAQNLELRSDYLAV
jgi:hypothetical protein